MQDIKISENIIFSSNNVLYFDKEFVENTINTIIALKNERNLENFLLFLGKIINDLENILKLKSYKEKEEHFEKEFFHTNANSSISCALNIFIAQLYNELALAQIPAEKIDEAKENLLKAYGFNNENMRTLYNLADLYLNTKAFEESIEYCDKILEKEENNIAAIYLKGLNFSCMGEPEKALKYFEKTVELDPQSIGANYYAGECLLHAKEYSKALKYYKNNHESKEGHLDSSRGLAICYLAEKEAEKSIEICNYILEKEAFQIITMQIKGDALIILKDFEQAGQIHAEIASVELDLRDFIVRKTHDIAKEYGAEDAKKYAGAVLEFIPDLVDSFNFLYEKVTIPKYKK